MTKVLGDPWTALGDPTRREVLARIAERPRSVGEIAAGLPVSRPAVSQHLAVLAGADLVEADRRGRKNIYRVRPEGFRRIRGDLERFWSEALENLKLLSEHDDTEHDTEHETEHDDTEETIDDH